MRAPPPNSPESWFMVVLLGSLGLLLAIRPDLLVDPKLDKSASNKKSRRMALGCLVFTVLILLENGLAAR